MRILTFDIGGANTKRLIFNDGKTESSLTYFPIWKEKDNLAKMLCTLKQDADVVAVTLTAEICDCFKTKEDGAKFIVSCCEKAFVDPFFLTVDKNLLKVEEIKDYRELAATNWLASTYLLEKRYGQGILLDIGSTTTDIIPFGRGIKHLKNDLERLKAGHLVYTGLLRTPVNTIVSELPLGNYLVPTASEFFAITADIYNLLWDVEYISETPDGRGKSKRDSKRRIARLLCADTEEVEEHIPDICTYVYKEQIKKIAIAVKQVSRESKIKEVYVAGVGRRLGIEAAELADIRAKDLEKEHGDAWNLPCMGLAEIAMDMERRR